MTALRAVLVAAALLALPASTVRLTVARGKFKSQNLCMKVGATKPSRCT
jgi:hypothetical protein